MWRCSSRRWPVPTRAIPTACQPRTRTTWRRVRAVVEASPGFPDPIWAGDQYLWAGAANRAYPRLPEMRDKMDPGFVKAVEMMAERSLFDSAKARLDRLELAATMGRFFGEHALLIT